MKGSIFLAREGRGDEGFEFLHVDSGFREKGSSICEKAMKGSSFFVGSELAPAQKINKKNGAEKTSFLCILLRGKFPFFVAGAPEHFCWIFRR